jgi:hypothetical protein
MRNCPVCGLEIEQSRYIASGEDYKNGSLKLVHIECCSTDDLRKLLSARAKREIEFFSDASKLSENLDLKMFKEFEKSYGDYYEVVETSSDQELAVLAIVSELKSRLTAPD